MGHDPKGVGAICDLTAFSGVVEVATKTVTGHQIVSEKVWKDRAPKLLLPAVISGGAHASTRAAQAV